MVLLRKVKVSDSGLIGLTENMSTVPLSDEGPLLGVEMQKVGGPIGLRDVVEAMAIKNEENYYRIGDSVTTKFEDIPVVAIPYSVYKREEK